MKEPSQDKHRDNKPRNNNSHQRDGKNKNNINKGGPLAVLNKVNRKKSLDDIIKF